MVVIRRVEEARCLNNFNAKEDDYGGGGGDLFSLLLLLVDISVRLSLAPVGEVLFALIHSDPQPGDTSFKSFSCSSTQKISFATCTGVSISWHFEIRA